MTGRIASTARVFMLAVALTAVTACETAVSDDDNDEDQRLTKDDWAAETIAGKAVINPGRVTLSFGEGRVSGRAGCNLYSGPVEYGKGRIKIGTLISTKMACMEEGVMAQESAYLSALGAADRYSFAGDGKLTIGTSAGPIVYDDVPKQVRPEG